MGDLEAFKEQRERNLDFEFITGTFAPLATESDPSGKDPKEGGAKLDAGKSPVIQGAVQYFPRALAAVANLSLKGANKYSWNGWRDVPDGVNRYKNAGGRHILDEAVKGDYDNDVGGTGELHATCVAWNFLAALELKLQGIEDNGEA